MKVAVSEGRETAALAPSVSRRARPDDREQVWLYIVILLGLTYFGTIGGSLFARVDFWLQVTNQLAFLSIALVLGLLRIIRREPLRVSAVELPVLVLPCLLFALSLTSTNARISLEQSLWWAMYALFFLLVADALSHTPMDKIVRAQLIASLVVASIAWLEGAAYVFNTLTVQGTTLSVFQALRLAAATHRLQLPLGNPNYLGWYMMLSLPWLVAYTTRKPLKPLRVARLILAGGMLGGVLILTQSRGAAIGLVASLALLAILYRTQYRSVATWLNRWHLAIIAGLIIFGFSLLSYAFIARGFGDGGQVRTQLRDQALSLFASHILTGTGPGTFGAVFPVYSFGSVDTNGFFFGNTHSAPIQFITVVGALGVLVIGIPLARAVAIVTATWRAQASSNARSDSSIRGKPYRLAAIAGLGGFLTVGLVDVPWTIPAVVGLAALALLALHREVSGIADLRLPRSFPFVVALLLATLTTYFQIGHWFYTQARDAAMAGDWLGAGAIMQQAVAWDGQNRLYQYEGDLLQTRLLLAGQDGADLQLLTDRLESETAQRKLAMDYVNLSWLYWRTGQKEKAVVAAQNASRRAPSNKWTRFSSGVMFLQVGNQEQAIEEFAEASIRDPRVLESAFWAVDPARQRITKAVAAEAIRLPQQEYGKPAISPETARLALIAGMDKDVEEYVSTHPNDWGTRAILGYSLLLKGQLQRAEEELRAGLGYPGFPDEGYYWLYRSQQGQGKLNEAQVSLESGAAHKDPASMYVMATRRNQEGAKVVAASLLEEALNGFAGEDWTWERTVLATDAYGRLSMPVGLFPTELTSLLPADMVPGYLLLSQIYGELGDNTKAGIAYGRYQMLTNIGG